MVKAVALSAVVTAIGHVLAFGNVSTGGLLLDLLVAPCLTLGNFFVLVPRGKELGLSNSAAGAMAISLALTFWGGLYPIALYFAPTPTIRADSAIWGEA